MKFTAFIIVLSCCVNVIFAQTQDPFRKKNERKKLKPPGSEKVITHYPLKYNWDDFDSKKDLTSHFVTTLVAMNTGQCYSMPLLYLILAERSGTEAYLSYAPQQ